MIADARVLRTSGEKDSFRTVPARPKALLHSAFEEVRLLADRRLSAPRRSLSVPSSPASVAPIPLSITPCLSHTQRSSHHFSGRVGDGVAAVHTMIHGLSEAACATGGAVPI